MSLFVISDLHIWGTDDPLYRSLLALLRDRSGEGDTVILAGDLFDLFVGNKGVFLDRYAEFVRELKGACARGVKAHYIEGNHDFLIRRAFAGIDGLTVHAHDIRLELSGKRFFIAHGDTVDRADYSYRALRVFFRSPVMKALVALTPGEWLDRIGQESSRRSRARKPLLITELPIERAERLRKVYRSYAAERITEGYDYVVLGHCHDLDQMTFYVGDRKGQYVNVGYPRAHGSFLSWQPGDPDIQREALPG